MALYYNNANIAQNANVFFNNAACKDVYFNNQLVWRKQLILFSAGTFGTLGVPIKNYVEGSAWQVSTINGLNWIINCDGRCDWWFPLNISGYNSINIIVSGREGAGACYMFATTGSRDKWGVNAEYVQNIGIPGTYSLPITNGTVWIGVEALKGGIYISNMWLS